MPWPDRVFVYGTLRAGQPNAGWLGGAPCLGTVQTERAFTLVDTGPYPAALVDGETALVGEIYAIDAPVLADLDVLEGYPDVYTRQVIDTPAGAAWIYLWIAERHPGWPVIASGDWLTRPALNNTGTP